MDNKASNTLISKSVQKRLAAQKGESVEKVGMRTTKFDEIKKLKEELETAQHFVEIYSRQNEEYKAYEQHYKIRIAELEKALKDNNIEIP